jgi:RNA polymerase sigma factor (sigma-70 family)
MPVPDPQPTSAFPATRWSLILDLRSPDTRASDQASEELCRLYWYPVYGFVRRQGAQPQDAEDLTQSFFASLLAHDNLSTADQSKGRLRSFILCALKNFLIQDWRHRTALKRGGGVSHVPLDSTVAEGMLAADLEARPHATPEIAFDRRWALDTMERAMTRLEEEYRSAGRTALHAALEPWLSVPASSAEYQSIGATLGMSASAVQVAVHRLRKRLRHCLEAVVAETCESQEAAQEELAYLLEVLASA